MNKRTRKTIQRQRQQKHRLARRRATPLAWGNLSHAQQTQLVRILESVITAPRVSNDIPPKGVQHDGSRDAEEIRAQQR